MRRPRTATCGAVRSVKFGPSKKRPGPRADLRAVGVSRYELDERVQAQVGTRPPVRASIVATDSSKAAGNQPHPLEGRISFSDLVKLARLLHRRSFGRFADEDELLTGIAETLAPARELRRDSPTEAVDATDVFDFTNGVWAATWCQCGLPRVRVRAARAASFAATSMPPEQATAVVPPWSAFLIELENVETMLTLPGSEDPFDRVEVLNTSLIAGSPTWSVFARSRGGNVLHRLLLPEDDWGAQAGDSGLFRDAAVDASERLLQVVCRIVLGTCLALSSPEERETGRHRACSKRFRRHRHPGVTDFVVGNDVRVDVRSAVGDYVAGGGVPPAVQSLVRGHWKRQAHGPGGALRRWIQIEPYWRGPEEGPVVVRKHVLV